MNKESHHPMNTYCIDPLGFVDGKHTHTADGHCVSNTTNREPVLTLRSAIHNLGQAAYNMRYDVFLAVLELEDDSYARDKYADFKAIGRAMAAFSDSDLARLTQHHEASS